MSEPTRDFAVEGSTGRLIVHRADCPHVRHLAALGEPVLTMLECAKEPSAEWPRHSCLEEQAA